MPHRVRQGADLSQGGGSSQQMEKMRVAVAAMRSTAAQYRRTIEETRSTIAVTRASISYLVSVAKRKKYKQIAGFLGVDLGQLVLDFMCAI